MIDYNERLLKSSFTEDEVDLFKSPSYLLSDEKLEKKGKLIAKFNKLCIALPKPPLLKSGRQVHGDSFESDFMFFEVVESEYQKLSIRVGSVFNVDSQNKDPGVWIEYQENFGLPLANLDDLYGPLLLSPRTAKKMAKWILYRLSWRFRVASYFGRKWFLIKDFFLTKWRA